MHNHVTQLPALLLAGALTTACGGTDFAGAGKTTPGPAPELPPPTGDALGDPEPAPPAGAPTTSIDAAGCLAAKAQLYNIVLVLDVSGSQEKTDPTGLRITGSQAFLTDMAAFADRHAGVPVNVATVAFAARAAPGAHGWQQLSSSTLDVVTGDIKALTSDTSGGTHYLEALEAADQLLTEKQAAATDAKQRNFIMFLTDGEPNGRGDVADINATVDAMTKTRGVAMVMVGTGSDVSTRGEAILQGMAMPQPGIVNPKHTGSYHRVKTQEQMQGIGTILSQAAAACE